MAMPQILQQLGMQTNPVMAKIKQAMSFLKASNDPQAMINQILKSNPQVNQIINQYGGVEEAITAICKQQGINPKDIADVLK